AFSARPPFIIYDTLYVKKNVSGSNGVGDSWANAINNLQEAIDRPGVQQVFVAKGTYQPSTNSSFKMKNNVAIYGGFNDTGNPGMEDRDWIAYPTILNGSGSSVIHNLYTNGAPLGANAILDGFTITGGSIRGFGGGIFNMYASPTLT